MLHINNLSATISQKKILHSVNLEILPGTIHALMGPNGSGKSTLAKIIAGHPSCNDTGGTIIFNGENLIALKPEERIQKGIFVAFQQSPAIPGVNVLTFLHETYCAVTKKQIQIDQFRESVLAHALELQFDAKYLERNVNEGFSGGERKKFEVLQILLLNPQLIILDEIDSGLDIGALKIVSHCITSILKESNTVSILLITHYRRILDYVKPDWVHILIDGSIVTSGTELLAQDLEARGYDVYRK